MASAPKAAAKVVALDEAGGAKSGKKKMMIIIGLAVAVLAGGGAGAFLFLKKPADPNAAKPAPKVEAPKPPVFLALDTFTVNLQKDQDFAEQYLQVNISLQVADQAQTDLMKQYMPLLRSRLLMLLSSRKASEISTAEGKQKLQDDIIALANEPFVPKGTPQDVSGVFFTSFVIQ